MLVTREEVRRDVEWMVQSVSKQDMPGERGFVGERHVCLIGKAASFSDIFAIMAM